MRYSQDSEQAIDWPRSVVLDLRSRGTYLLQQWLESTSRTAASEASLQRGLSTARHHVKTVGQHRWPVALIDLCRGTLARGSGLRCLRGNDDELVYVYRQVSAISLTLSRAGRRCVQESKLCFRLDIASHSAYTPAPNFGIEYLPSAWPSFCTPSASLARYSAVDQVLCNSEQ